MQKYAEEAVEEHIGGFLQPKFFNEKKGRSYAPFARNLSKSDIETILNKAMKQSDRYRYMSEAGASEGNQESFRYTCGYASFFLAWNDRYGYDSYGFYSI